MFNRALVGLVLCSFVVATDGTVVIGLLGKIAMGVDASPARTGQAVTVFALAYVLGGPAVIWLGRSWPNRRLLLVGLGLFVAANLGTAAAASLSWLLAARALAGVAAGTLTPTAARLASAITPVHRRGEALAVVVGGASLSAVVGVPLGTLTGAYLGWRIIFLAIALTAAALMVALARQAWPSRERESGSPVRLGRAARVVAVTFLWSTGSFIFFSYLSVVLLASAGVAGGAIAGYLFVFGAAGVAGAILAGRAIDARGPIPVVLTGLALIVAALLGFAALTKAAAASHDAVILAAILVAVYGAGTWAITPAQQYRLLGAKENERILLSLNASAVYAGVGVGAAAGGIVLAVNGSVPALCLSATAFELAAATVLLLCIGPPVGR